MSVLDRAYRLVRPIVKPVLDRNKHQIFIDLANHLKVTELTIDGQYGPMTGSMSDPFVFGGYIRNGIFAKGVNDALDRFFAGKNEGTLLDIGANIGMTIVPTARNPNIHCIGIEAEPQAFGFMKRNVERNSTGNVELHEVAVYDSAKTLEFSIDPINFGRHHVKHSAAQHGTMPSSNTIQVRADRLENIIDASKITKPFAIKMDVEGSEYHAYLGGRQIFQQADFFVTEFWPLAIKRLGGDPSAYLDMLEQDFPFGAVIRWQKIGDNIVPISKMISEARKLISSNDHFDLTLSKTPTPFN